MIPYMRILNDPFYGNTPHYVNTFKIDITAFSSRIYITCGIMIQTNLAQPQWNFVQCDTPLLSDIFCSVEQWTDILLNMVQTPSRTHIYERSCVLKIIHATDLNGIQMGYK